MHSLLKKINKNNILNFQQVKVEVRSKTMQVKKI